jgi:glycosyltransferase involved in cell wall biosynthesis
VSTCDKAGGAEKIAYELFQSQRLQGHDAYLAVGKKTLDEAHILAILNDAERNVWAKSWRYAQDALAKKRLQKLSRIAGWAANIGELKRWSDWQKGREDFHFPATKYLQNLPPEPPEVIHLHNLHGGYFDLTQLPAFSKSTPVFLTLHDEWIYTGHCSYTFGCERWQEGCGKCPSLDTYPAVRRDSTAFNLERKSRIYSQSKLYIAAPSRWLLDKASRSILQAGVVEMRLIPYGIDLAIFKPEDKNLARRELQLPQDAAIVLFVANKTKSNPFKDYETLEQAMAHISEQAKGLEIVLLCIGENKPQQRIGSVDLRFIAYQNSPAAMARYYQAADVYLHAAKTEAFGLVMAEAMACGIPVVATAVDGIPEVVLDGRTGFLVPPKDSQAMALRTLALLNDEELKQKMSAVAIDHSRQFDLKRQVKDYLNWYAEVLQEHENLNRYAIV